MARFEARLDWLEKIIPSELCDDQQMIFFCKETHSAHDKRICACSACRDARKSGRHFKGNIFVIRPVRT